MINLSQYNLWLFDCDGVILQSNHIKTQAMYQVALHFSDEKIARVFQQYHQKNAGVTRFIKFKYLFETLLNLRDFEEDYQQAINMFGALCLGELKRSALTDGALTFLNNIDERHKRFIISAGTETELQSVFTEKKLGKHFSGIYGGPRTKFQIFSDILNKYPNANPIYFGDAEADYIVAKEFDVDFVFLSDYTEFACWRAFFAKRDSVKVIKNFSDF